MNIYVYIYIMCVCIHICIYIYVYYMCVYIYILCMYVYIYIHESVGYYGYEAINYGSLWLLTIQQMSIPQYSTNG